ncbi:MAG: hypothetical protein LAT55_00685 [Opitutales bacterium]|nr:hypothetical protein [Opitutales bacterium]
MENKKLQEFVTSHPEFFERKGDCFVLKSDIHHLVEEYARLVDPDEYERVRQLVAAVQRDHREELEQEIRASQEEILRQKQQLSQYQLKLQKHDDEMNRVKGEISGLKVKMSQMMKVQKPIYASALVFWLLAAIGVGCMYIGFFFTMAGASAFLPVGLVLLLLGLMLQSRQLSSNRSPGVREEALKAEIRDLESKLPMLKIQRATALQQIIVAKQGIDHLEGKIRSFEHKKKIING